MGGNRSVPGACCTEAAPAPQTSLSFSLIHSLSLPLLFCLSLLQYRLMLTLSTVCEYAPLCPLKLSHNEARGCWGGGAGRGGDKWKDVRYSGRGGWNGREADKLAKEQELWGENKRFPECPRSAFTAWRWAKIVAIVLAQKSLKVPESYLLFLFRMWHLGQGLHCSTCDIHILCVWRWLCNFKR